MAKLYSAGVADVYLRFLNAFLEPRVGRVAVGGVLSELIVLDDMVFQGTVLGPVLWNIFFMDVVHAVTWQDAEPASFADDLPAHKTYGTVVDNAVAIEDLKKTQAKVHAWGRRNRVSFDAGKEHILILHPRDGCGEPCKYLGCMLDCFLVMDKAVDNIMSWARPKVKALLRTKGQYNVSGMLHQYKAHIWGGTEYANGAILHASDTVLSRLDRLQKHFLDELHLTAEVAFLDYNFGPPTLRRDIGILGFIHKRVLGCCHPGIASLLPFATAPSGRWHGKQLVSHLEECIYRRNWFFKSLFGYVLIYNRLPPFLVEMPTVKEFQKELTKMARCRCLNGDVQWPLAFHTDTQLWRTRFAMSA